MHNVLELVLDMSRPDFPTVHVVVDDRESLDGGDHSLGHDPADLLDTGALLPRDEPHRVALHGCCCGEFGCSALTARIVRDGPVVRWTGIAVVGGAVFDRALSLGGFVDPVRPAAGPPAVPDLVFAADAYTATVRAAMADRSWETRPRAVARLARRHLGWAADDGQVLAWPDEEDAVAVNVRLDGHWATVLVPIPDGSDEDAAAHLARALVVPDPRGLPGARRVDL